MRAYPVVFTALAFLTIATANCAGETRGYTPAGFEEEPGILFYMFQEDRFWQDGVFAARKHGCAESVTPPGSLECYFPPVDGPSGWLELDLEQALPKVDSTAPGAIPAEVTGLVFFVRGDGSSGKGRVELRSDYRAAGPGVDFELSDTKWHPITVTWESLGPDFDASKAQALAFGVTTDTARPAGYLVDAIQFAVDAADRAALDALAAGANAIAEPPAVPIRVSPGACTYNKAGIAVARGKAHRGEPMKWLAYGDSVTVPVQMWNIPEDVRPAYAYYNVAARMLEREYGCEIAVVVNAVGGRQLSEDFDVLLDTLDSERPDVLIMHPWDNTRNYQVYMPRALEKARAAGAELVVVIPVYDAFPYRDAAIDWLRRWCVDNNVAAADARTYLLEPGKIYWGGLFANPYHPGPEGHRLMGQALSEMFR